jgi:N-methylhydantoinase B
VREIEMLADAHVTPLADRRRFRPYGLQGGGAEGASGCLRSGLAAGKSAFRASAAAVLLLRARCGSKHRAEAGGAKIKQR